MIRSLIIIGSVGAFIAAGFQGAQALDIRSTLLSTTENRVTMQSLGALASKPIVKDTAKKIAVKAGSVALDQATKVVKTLVTKKNVAAVWDAIEAKTDDPAVKDVLERVQWAEAKSDISLCQDLVAKPGVSVGDAVALCIARVTGDGTHCVQIDALRSPVLSAACRETLAIGS